MTMRSSERGFSLMEITVVLAIVSVIMILIYSLMEESMRVTLFNESHNDLTIFTQNAVNTLQSDVQQSKVAFEEDSLGISYRSALVMPAGVTAWTDSRLPRFAETGEIEPDPANQTFTGNSLLIARQLPPIQITYNHDNNVNTAEVQFLADLYQFEYIYLSRSTAKSFGGSGMTMDLLVSYSAPYADYFQLDALDDAGTASAVQRLIAASNALGYNITRAWNPGAAVNSAFYTLSGATDGTFNAAINNATIPITHTTTLLRPYFGVRDWRGLLKNEQRLAGGRGISGRIDYSVAFGTFSLPQPMRVFAQPDNSKPGFPSGFEVKIAGPARNRKVMTRLVMMSHYGGKKHYEAQQAFVITAARF